MKTILKSFDIHGFSNFFYIDNNTKYTTKLGGFFTLTIIIIFTVLIYAFGQDMLNRLNPISYVQEKIESDKVQFTDIDYNSFPLAFRIEDENAIPIENQMDKFIFENYYYEYEMKDGVFENTNFFEVDIKQCNQTSFYLQNKELYDKQGLSNYFCYDFDKNTIKLGGNWDEKELKYFYSHIYFCSKSSYNVNGKKCSEDEVDLDNKLYYFSIFLPNAYIDPSNYTNPIYNSIKNFFYKLDKGLYKSMTFNFQDVLVVSDIGWLIESIDKKSTITVSEVRIDNSLKGTSFGGDINNRILGTTVFYKQKVIKHYIRIYQKLQTLAANIGGMLKIYSVFISFFIQFYNKMNLIYNLSKILMKIKQYRAGSSKENSKIINLKDNSHEILKIEKKIKMNNLIKEGEKNKKKKDISSNIIKSLRKKTNQEFNFSKYLFHILCCCNRKSKSLYRNIYSQVIKSYDIKNYLINNEKIDIIIEKFMSEDEKVKINSLVKLKDDD